MQGSGLHVFRLATYSIFSHTPSIYHWFSIFMLARVNIHLSQQETQQGLSTHQQPALIYCSDITVVGS